MEFRESERVRNLPPYLFARIERLIAEKRSAGVDVISLGIGDPDRPTPEHIVAELTRAAHKPENHRYPSSEGMPEFRRAAAGWMRERFGVELDPRTEVVALIGSKEGIAHLPWCYLDPGDLALVPDPAYPVYAGGTLLTGGVPYYLPLEDKNGFLPDLSVIPADVARRAKLLFLNYPNNPTGAVAGREFFEGVVDFAREYEVLVCHDAAYSEISYDGYRAPSILEVPGAAEVAVEIHSLSKTFNMTGWRIGWAAGHKGAVGALARLKSNIDSGVFGAVQEAAIAALTGPREEVAESNMIYKARRDLLVDGLNGLGFRIKPPQAAIYLWVKVPQGHDAASFAEFVLERAGVVITPGTGYGPHGEGWFRLSLTTPTERIREALVRLEALGPVSVRA
ncbi:MAG TPA: LL-diaminopimelate aminotransferase [Spirochaetia bacterium]|nr:LL-diaminopimelate aminotransferase [Spirochaetia bacterium]